MRTIVVVKSCRANVARQEACRDTWAGDLNRRGVPLWFLEGDHPAERVVECWLQLTGGDAYDDNSFKVRDAIAFFLRYDPFDRLFICDDDTFVHPARWMAYEPEGEFVGKFAPPKVPWVHGGGGWFMSRRACELFVDGIRKRCSWDDQLAWEILCKGHRMPAINRPDLFSQWPDERVSESNRLITCHKVEPDEMRDLYAKTHAIPLVYDVLP